MKEKSMICPQCNAEYIDGILECADCQIPLTEGPGDKQGPKAEWEGGIFRDDLEYVKIVSLVNLSDILVVKSIFDSEQIEYYIKGWNSYLHKIFGFEATIFVEVEHEQDARNLIQGLEFNNYRFSTNTDTDDEF
jgi:hypothetical protein